MLCKVLQVFWTVGVEKSVLDDSEDKQLSEMVSMLFQGLTKL